MKQVSVKNRILLKVLAVAMVICYLLSSGLSVSAATGPLVTLEKSMDITIIVGYDTEKPVVVFNAPNGKKYEKPEDFDQVIEGDNATYYCISNASSGDWTVDYEKGKNQEITIDVLPWHKNISIENAYFSASPEAGMKVPKVIGGITVNYGNNYYRYIITAVQLDADENITTRIKLCDGSGSAGGEENFAFYPEMLMDGDYRLMVEVYGEDGTGVEVRDSMLLENTLSISGNTAAGKDECLYIECNVTDGTVDIHFDASAQECNCDEFALMIVQGDAKQYLAAQSYYDRVFDDHILFDPADGDITVQINAKDRDAGFISWSKTFKPELPISLEIETAEITNGQNAVIKFDAGSSEYPGRIILNEAQTEIVWRGSSTAQVSLESMATNDLTIQVEDGNVCYTETKVISVDTMPPYIDIYGATDSMVTSESTVRFAGKTDAGELSCNGEKIACEADGSFSYIGKMDEDEKTFTFEASDSAGNITARSIHVTKKGLVKTNGTRKKDNGIKPLLFTIGISMFLALFTAGLTTLLMKRNEKKGRAVKTVPTVIFSFAVSMICCFIGAGIWQLIMHFKAGKDLSGSSFIDLLKKTPLSEVASKIDEKKEYLASSIISFSAAAFLIIILVIVSIIKKKAAKKTVQA